mgnify:CR=1 FL=1
MSTITTSARPQPAPPREGTVALVRDETSVVRSRTFSPSMELMHIIMQLRRERVTGSLILDFNQGGVRSIRMSETSKIDLP